MQTGRRNSQQWRSVVLIWAMGLLAAAQLGKMAAMLAPLRQDYGLSLVRAGWIASLIEAGGASLGLAAGLLVGFFGSRPALGLGLVLIASAGAGEALAPDVQLLVIMRLVEAAGYLLVVISGPSLIATIAPSAERGAALALWSTFVPAGLALGIMATSLAIEWASRPAIFLAWGLLALAAIAGWLRLPRPMEHGIGRFVLPGLPIWLLAIGFGAFTAGEVGILAMLPTYLAEQMGLAPGLAGLAAGLASLATLVGSVAAARALSRKNGQRPPAHRTVRLAAAGLLPPALLAFAVFVADGPFGSAAVLAASLAAIAANAFLGLYPAIAFARLPDLVSRPEAIASSNGVLAQFGAAGALLGPPLTGFAASNWGWSTVAPAAAVCFILSLLMTVLAERVTRPV